MARVSAVVVLVVLVAAVAYVAWWFVLATEARSAVETWAAERRAEGWTVSYDGLETGGFPATVRLTVQEPELVPPDPDAGWRWRGPALVAEASPLEPRRITVRPVGDQRLELGPAEAPTRLGISAREIEAVVDATAAPAMTITGFANAAVITANRGEPVAIDRLDASGRSVPGGADPSAATADVTVSAAEITLPPADDLPFGRGITRIGLDATVVGPLDAAGGAAGILRWRDAGGVLEISRLAVDYGPLEGTADGTFALDGDGQPRVSLSARVRGLGDALEVLRERGVIPAQTAIAARLAVAALGRTPADGGVTEVTINLSIRNRVVSIGPIALFTLPPILWSGLVGR